MEQTRLMAIIRAAQKGRAISPDYIKKVTDEYLKKTLADHLPEGTGEDAKKTYQRYLDRILFREEAGLPWGIFAQKYWEQNHQNLDKEVEDFSYIGLPGSYANKSVPIYKLAVADYLHYAGMDAEYEKWFKKDCEVWEESHDGASPDIGDVLHSIGGFLENNGYMFIHYKEEYMLRGTEEDKVTLPFVRDRRTDVHEHYLILLAVVWSWMLMIEAPHRILERGGGTEK